MPVWERERVLALAPDPTALAAARRLRPAAWSALGSSARAIWGRCQGSDPQPYQTMVDLELGPGYACGCPSRRAPCKHALALLLLWSEGGVPAAEEAPTVAAWLGARRTRAARPTVAARVAPADPVAAERRVAARQERVAGGLDELERWLGDQVRAGIAPLPQAGYAHFDAIAARMVDAQAPGVASMLRSIPGELVGEGWPERLLAALAALHLLVQAHRRLPDLPAGLAATVRSRVGYPVARDGVLGAPGLHDRWLAVGAVDTVEAQLVTRRVWLCGLDTERWALWLTFAAPGQQLDRTLSPGQVFAGKVHVYPGSGQYRVALGEGDPAAPELTPEGVGVAALHQRFAALLAEDPWASRMPAVLRARVAPPVRTPEPWRLVDPAGHTVPLERLPGDPWPLVAHSAAGPARIFGEWTGRVFRPLSVLVDDRVITAVGP